MKISQFVCQDCNSVFDHLISDLKKHDISCILCEGVNVKKQNTTIFSPDRVFCPKNRFSDMKNTKPDLSRILTKHTKCSGCN